jgi:hypothetical protein
MISQVHFQRHRGGPFPKTVAAARSPSLRTIQPKVSLFLMPFSVVSRLLLRHAIQHGVPTARGKFLANIVQRIEPKTPTTWWPLEKKIIIVGHARVIT